MALFVYVVVAAGSISALVWKHPLGEVVARRRIGAGFTLVCLVTGPHGASRYWGTWWAWDARLTSMLILLFLYFGYMALVNAFDDPERGHKAAAILALVGAVNVPVIKWSVDWWNTLHQPASVAHNGPAIHPSMLLPLLLMATGFAFYFATVLLLRVRAELAARRIRALRLAAMEAEA
jgi:heme exporter protein C